MENSALEIKNLSFSYDKTPAVDNVSLSVKRGQFVGIIGPNGSGKSTLLKNVYRALSPDKGEIFLDGENLPDMSFKSSARKMAVVGQENELPFDFKVREIVAMGRSPYKGLFDADTDEDREIVMNALKQLGMEELAAKNYRCLSGGEKQRVIIARALAQNCGFLVLDEPTNHLDISYQMQIFDFIKRLKVTVLSAIHDLNLAALYCDYIYVMKEGKIVLQGGPEEIFKSANLYDVFGVCSNIEISPITGKPAITFYPERLQLENKRRIHGEI